MTKVLVIGSRNSDLALWQAKFVKGQLQAAASTKALFKIKTITTTGDELADVALSKIGDKGLFTRQIENELLRGEIDFAVHSLKDLQTAQPDGLAIGAFCRREVANDALISRRHASIDELPEAGKVATGSLRRRSQILHRRPDLRIVDIRGNVPTRLKKFDESDLDALVLAYAGLHRLGLDERVRQLIPFDVMLPAVGQGAVAVEIREDDKRAADLAKSVDDMQTRLCVTAERAFLRRLEGGCQVPIGAHATLEGDRLFLEGMVGSLDGSKVYRDRIEGDAGSGEVLGHALAENLIEKGADYLLAETRAEMTSAPRSIVG